MSKSGVSVAAECIAKFQELKLGKSVKYIIYKLTDDNKEIVVEDSSTNADWEEFREKLITAKSKNKMGKEGKGPRYAVYDFEYELEGGEGTRNKIVFVSWSPDDAMVQPKMVYASSKESLKLALNGLSSEVQANDEGELEYAVILDAIRKGK